MRTTTTIVMMKYLVDVARTTGGIMLGLASLAGANRIRLGQCSILAHPAGMLAARAVVVAMGWLGAWLLIGAIPLMAVGTTGCFFLVLAALLTARGRSFVDRGGTGLLPVTSHARWGAVVATATLGAALLSIAIVGWTALPPRVVYGHHIRPSARLFGVALAAALLGLLWLSSKRTAAQSTKPVVPSGTGGS